MSKLRAYCELVRLPNVFTALADILAGYWLLSYEFRFTPTLAWLLLASAALYSAGIVFNDLHDVGIDRLERATRPLPSGRVSLRSARMVGISLSLIGIIAAAAAGRDMSISSRHPVTLAVVLLLAIISYDFFLKSTVLGPLNMGLCRGLNFLLGASAGTAAQHGQAPPPLAYFALGAVLFVASLTLVARGEVGGAHRGRALLGIFGIAVATLLIGGLSIAAGEYNDFTLVLWLALAIHLARISLRMVRYPSPAIVPYAVKTYVMSIVVLDAVMASAYHGWHAGIAVLALLIPALVLGRWIYST